MKKILLLVSSVFLINTAYAQAESDAQKISTKLEAFQAKTGVVLIKGYTNVGVLKEHGSTRVVAHDLRDASNPKVRFTGISITLTYSDEWESRAYFDVDDIDSLIAGIDYITKVTKEVSSSEEFEVEYISKGGFRVTVFEIDGVLRATVSAGSIKKRRLFLEISGLLQLRQLIINAKSKIT